MAFTSMPSSFTGEIITRMRNDGVGATRVSERYTFWEVQNPNLDDDDENQVDSFRVTYRMGRDSFNWLVNRLSTHPEFDFKTPNNVPIYIQIATCLLRLANCHLRYRNMYVLYGVSYGSYTNFTRRNVKAIKDVLSYMIDWPINSAMVGAISAGFNKGPGVSIPDAIGAIDGKNFTIHKPTPAAYGAGFRDRKNNYTIKLTAVCDDTCRFTYIRVGDSGNNDQYKYESWKLIYF